MIPHPFFYHPKWEWEFFQFTESLRSNVKIVCLLSLNKNIFWILKTNIVDGSSQLGFIISNNLISLLYICLVWLIYSCWFSGFATKVKTKFSEVCHKILAEAFPKILRLKEGEKGKNFDKKVNIVWPGTKVVW